MSWFFYKGGMMHKEKPLKDILYKSYKRLLVPYLIFLFIGFVLDGVIKFSLYEHYSVTSFIKEEFITVIKKSVLHPTAVSWFLLSLFVVRLVFNYCCTRIHSLILVLLFAGLATGINFLTVRGCVFDMNLFGHDFCINVPFYIGNMCHGLSLYSLGYYLKEKQYQKLFFYLALMLFVMKFFIPAGLDFRANDSGESNFVLAVIYGMAGCVVANNIFRYCFDFNVPFMTYIGQNSMVYYLCHYPVLMILVSFFSNYWMTYGFIPRFIIISLVVTVSLIIANYIFRNDKLKFIIGA